MMPRTGSYGETPTVTRSPGTTLMRKRRIRRLHMLQPVDPDWHHLDRQPRRDHADPRPKAADRAVFRTAAFRKDQHREAVLQDLADVAECLPGAGLPLRQRERVEEECGERV